MQKTVLNDVFELLQQIGAVGSESEFSRDWLGRSEGYVRTLRFKRVKPSVVPYYAPLFENIFAAKPCMLWVYPPPGL